MNKISLHLFFLLCFPFHVLCFSVTHNNQSLLNYKRFLCLESIMWLWIKHISTKIFSEYRTISNESSILKKCNGLNYSLFSKLWKLDCATYVVFSVHCWQIRKSMQSPHVLPAREWWESWIMCYVFCKSVFNSSHVWGQS